MLKLSPVLKNYLWGGRKLHTLYGRENGGDRISESWEVSIHPDDDYARRVEGDNGKTEMWYIVDAEENAGIYCGFQRHTTPEEFLAKVQDGTAELMLTDSI